MICTVAIAIKTDETALVLWFHPPSWALAVSRGIPAVVPRVLALVPVSADSRCMTEMSVNKVRFGLTRLAGYPSEWLHLGAAFLLNYEADRSGKAGHG